MIIKSFQVYQKINWYGIQRFQHIPASLSKEDLKQPIKAST
jgi:hypothetical protein